MYSATVLRQWGRKGKKEGLFPAHGRDTCSRKGNVANNFWQFCRKIVAAAKRKAPGAPSRRPGARKQANITSEAACPA